MEFRYSLHTEALGFQELGHMNPPSWVLILNIWTGGVAVRPKAAVLQTLKAASHGRGPPPLPVVAAGLVLQASLPAVESFREGGASNLNIHPGAEEKRGEERNQ